jgi:hypothetical protein
MTPLLAREHLYERARRPRAARSFVQTPDDLHAWLDAHDVRYVVLDDRLPACADRTWDAPPRVLLREMAGSDEKFERVHTQPIAGDDPAWRGVNLVTYRYDTGDEADSRPVPHP